MNRQKESPAGQGRGSKNTNRNKFACEPRISFSKQMSSHHGASVEDLRNAWIASTTDQLAREICLVALAADRLARGYGLSGDDLDRLHDAHQYIIQALSSLTGREVMG